MVWSTPKGRYITEHEMSFIEFEDGKTPQKPNGKTSMVNRTISYTIMQTAPGTDGNPGNGGVRLKASTNVLVELSSMRNSELLLQMGTTTCVAS